MYDSQKKKLTQLTTIDPMMSSSVSYPADDQKKLRAVEMLIKAANSKTQQKLADSLDSLKVSFDSFDDRLNEVHAESVKNQLKLAETLAALDVKLNTIEKTVQSKFDNQLKLAETLAALDVKLNTIEKTVQSKFDRIEQKVDIQQVEAGNVNITRKDLVNTLDILKKSFDSKLSSLEKHIATFIEGNMSRSQQALTQVQTIEQIVGKKMNSLSNTLENTLSISFKNQQTLTQVQNSKLSSLGKHIATCIEGNKSSQQALTQVQNSKLSSLEKHIATCIEGNKSCSQ